MNHSFSEHAAALMKSLAGKELPVTWETLNQFETYRELLTEWNEKFNLTAITEPEEVYIKHFLDSIAAAAVIPEGASVCDVGSGAGFPGLPLKILRPDLRVLLIDSLNKRVGFLSHVIAALDLKEIRAEHIRAEDAAAPKNYRESFDITCARAVAPLATLCEYALPLTRVGGAFIAYKTAAGEELSQAERAIKILGGGKPEILPYTLPGEQSRVLIKIPKTAPSPAAYPRAGNKPRTQPL